MEGDHRPASAGAAATPRIVVVTNGNFFARIILDRIFRERGDSIAGVVIVTGIKAGKSKVSSLREILARSGARFFAYKASVYIAFAAASLLLRGRSFFVYGLANERRVPVMFADQVNSPSVAVQVSEWSPDVLLSVSCPQIIRKRLLDVPRSCALNIHSSLLPDYAGIAPYFWALARGEEATGTTVHVMDEQLDTGSIVAQKHVPIRKEHSVLSLFLELSRVGGDALAEAVDRVARGDRAFTQQDLTGRSYFGWPSAADVRAFVHGGGTLARASDYIRAIRAVPRAHDAN